MLRITIDQLKESAIIKLEGRIAGPWADELSAVWCEFARTFKARSLTIDLCGVTYADASGMQVLRQIYREKSPSFIASSPLSESLAEEACSEPTRNSLETNNDSLC
jgi:ABC-type transporter Mla MlaB component